VEEKRRILFNEGGATGALRSEGDRKESGEVLKSNTVLARV
jgi:hypothetical protein